MTTFTSLFLSLFVSISFAQTQKSTLKQKVNTSKISQELSKPSDSVTKGFRLGFSRPKYAAGTVIGFNMPGFRADIQSPDIDYTNVLSFGYQYLPVGRVGFIADLDYIELRANDLSSNVVRIEGNGAYTFNRYFNLHAGLNVADLVSKGASKWDRGVGTQIGLGFQFSRNFSFELNYSETNLSSIIPLDSFVPGLFATSDLKIRGYDLSLIGTF